MAAFKLKNSAETWGGGAAAGLANFVRRGACLAVSALFALPIFMGSASIATAEDRALKLFFTHTGERATITFKRDGKFDKKGLTQINRFLRDWRRNEPARMDPRLLDLVWEVYDRSGAKDYIHIVSAYRSPATNNMLRSRSRSTGVAKKSQHMLGKAMDFYIPGVKLSTLRTLAMQAQVGGVGFYPSSGSPFVHLDVGNVRAWPRMSRKELSRIFPNGRTMHLAADGSSLLGYSQAVADYRKRVGPSSIKIARTAGEDDNAQSTARASGRTEEAGSLLTALYSAPKSRALDALALQTGSDGHEDKQSFVDLSSNSVPVPTLRPTALPTEANSLDNLKTASIGPITTLSATEAILPLPISIGFEPLATAQLALKKRMETIRYLPMTGSWQAGADFGAISGKALMTWALHSPGAVIGMRAPRVSSRTFQVAATSINDVVIPITEARSFNSDRFGEVPES